MRFVCDNFDLFSLGEDKISQEHPIREHFSVSDG
jgi:hypothetical protein